MTLYACVTPTVPDPWGDCSFYSPEYLGMMGTSLISVRKLGLVTMMFTEEPHDSLVLCKQYLCVLKPAQNGDSGWITCIAVAEVGKPTLSCPVECLAQNTLPKHLLYTWHCVLLLRRSIE